MDNKILWDNCLSKIKEEVSPILFETWFENTKLHNIEDNKVIVTVPIHVAKKMLSENYNDLIEETFTEVSGSNFKFEYKTEQEIEENIKIDTNILGVPSVSNFSSNLNSNYTFDNYIVGESNKFAKMTAMAVAEKPGKMYNPLFIYAKSGLGKTHLMHAIGNYIKEHSNNRVLYVTCEKFVSDFVEINMKVNGETNINAVEIFKKKYRDVDVLLIDDIQFLGNRVKTQQEFFNTFNELYDKNKQIIISSDSSPDDLKLLEERLTTRFNWGITIPIEQPDFELRMKIIDNKLDGHILKDEFSKEVKEYIASNCTSDIRKLEGAITRVTAYATMMGGSKITLELASEALKDFFVKSIVSKNKIDKIQQIVATNYNISVDDLKSKKRNADIAIPRQIAMYICRKHLNEPLQKIGIEFGGKDHTTVMHSVDKISNKMKENPKFALEIEKIINKI